MHERLHLDSALNKGIKSILDSWKESSLSQEQTPLPQVRNIRRRKCMVFYAMFSGYQMNPHW